MKKAETIGQVRANLAAANREVEQLMSRNRVLEEQARSIAVVVRREEAAKIADMANYVAHFASLLRNLYQSKHDQGE